MNVNAQTIELYSKHLRTPAFNHYEDVIRQLGAEKGYGEFWHDPTDPSRILS
jgi:hypothetical protein